MSLNRISRRDALLALGVAAMRPARADGGLLRATRVDHVALAVGDIDKALVFYRSLFGNEVLKDSRTPRRYLRLLRREVCCCTCSRRAHKFLSMDITQESRTTLTAIPVRLFWKPAHISSSSTPLHIQTCASM